MSEKKKVAKTILTFHLPTAVDGGIPEDERTATLLIQRGDLGQARQFYYHGLFEDIVTAMREGIEALGLIEDNPPVIPDAPEEKKKKSKSKGKKQVKQDEEPTIEVPLTKGTRQIKMSYIKIVSGDSDAGAYRQAVVLAGRLINGGLWDGEYPICFNNVHEVASRMKPLQDNELQLFELKDFAQTEVTTTEKIDKEAAVDKTQEVTVTEDADEVAEVTATEVADEVAEVTVTEVTVTEDADEVAEITATEEVDEVVEANETSEMTATEDAGKAYLQMLQNILSSENEQLLKPLASRINESVEKVVHRIGFWRHTVSQNELKADLQNALLSPEFNTLLGIIDKRHQIIDEVLEIAKPEQTKSYPETIDSPAKRAFYDNLQDDAELAHMIYEEIQQGKKDSWKGNLLKERLVKGIIAAYVDGKAERVEALFEIAVNSEEFDTQVSV